MNGGGDPGHLEHHVGAEPARRRLHDLLGLLGADRVVSPHLLRQRQAGFVHIGRNDA